MRLLIFKCCLLIIFALFTDLQASSLGTATQVIGPVSARDATGALLRLSKHADIIQGQTLLLGDGSRVEFRLNDGSFFWVYGPASLTVNSCREEPDDFATEMYVTYGKIRAASQSVDNNLSLRINTPTAEISAVKAEFFLIASRNETVVAVSRYKIAVASSDQKIREAHIVFPGEESIVAAGRAPEAPSELSPRQLRRWIKNRALSGDKQSIIFR